MSRLRTIAKAGAMALLGSGPLVRRKLDRIAAAGVMTVLNLHRVARDDSSSYPPLDPQLFEHLLEFVKRHFEPVTFATAAAEPRSAKPKIVLSFDDAYKDFLEVAVPLLEKHGIAVNQNVIPECIESGLPPLNVMLQDFVGRAPRSILERLDVPGLKLRSVAGSRIALGNEISNHIKGKPIAEQKVLDAVLSEQIADYPEFVSTRMMSREDVRQIAAVHEIGAHSFRHASMAAETDEYLRGDIARCRDYFGSQLGIPLAIYAFPNNSYRAEQIDILRSEGIRHILLVDEDFSNPATHVHRRFTFHAYSRPEVRFRATGGYRWPRRAAA